MFISSLTTLGSFSVEVSPIDSSSEVNQDCLSQTTARLQGIFTKGKFPPFPIKTFKRANDIGQFTDVDFREVVGNKPNIVPIVSIGDSFVEALQVENGETYHGRLNNYISENNKIIKSSAIGTSGNPLSQYLINSGIKELLIVDGDIVEKSNLNRQILFNLNDIGRKKVDVAKNKLQLINTECKIHTIDENINSLNLNSLKECSIIVDATDDWVSSKLLNEYCLKNSINFLYSSALRHDLQIILFNNSNKNNHLCLNCIFPNKDDVNLPRCDVVGISGISAGLAGLIAAQKIINFYLNLKDETNIMTISDGKKLSIDNIVIKSKHDCYLKSV